MSNILKKDITKIILTEVALYFFVYILSPIFPVLENDILFYVFNVLFAVFGMLVLSDKLAYWILGCIVYSIMFLIYHTESGWFISDSLLQKPNILLHDPEAVFFTFIIQFINVFIIQFPMWIIIKTSKYIVGRIKSRRQRK